MRRAAAWMVHLFTASGVVIAFLALTAFDLIVDYLNYVFVPAIFICRAGLVPQSLALPLAAAMLLSSVYVFVRRDMKTQDNYFRGFPALWNVVALYLFAARPDPVVGAVVVVLFAVLSFAPIRFVHPFRVRDYQPWLKLLAMLWAAATLALLWPGWSGGAARAWLAASLAAAAALFALGLVRTVTGARRPAT
jgi:phosphatidylcholine synthase